MVLMMSHFLETTGGSLAGRGDIEKVVLNPKLDNPALPSSGVLTKALQA